MDLGTAFEFSVARDPHQPAIVDGDYRRTYRQWYADVMAVAGGLRRLGLNAGDHLVIVMQNRHQFATLYWAAQMLGAICTPVSWRGSRQEIRYCIEDSEATHVALDGAAADSVLGAADDAGIPGNRLVVTADAGEADAGTSYASLLDGDPLAAPVRGDDHDTALMLYTSGTTGRPKGVPRSHRNELAASISQIAHNRYRMRDSALGVMPLFHTMGVRVMTASVLLNGKYVCVPAYSAETVMHLVQEQRLSSLFLVPTMFHDIVQNEATADFDTSSLTHLGYAGMSMTDALTRACQEFFRPGLFVNYYGSSEIYTFAVCDELERKPGCAGRAGINQRLLVVDAGSGDVSEVLAPGQTGEIIASLSSPEAFAGYWKRPDADRKSLVDGWYRTGDLGRMDEEGDLYVVGRVDDMIISGGENIYPEEVEQVLAGSELVSMGAVIGMPDDRLGSRVVAFVVPSNAAVTAEQIDKVFLESDLPRFKRPREYVFIDEVPRSASGKILRRRLRDGEYRRAGGGLTSEEKS